MFIFTAKLRRTRVAAVLSGILVIALAVAAAVHMLEAHDTMAAAADPTGIRTNEDRVFYLNSWGWQVSPQPITVEELVIPKEFDDVLAEYAKIQSDQGFELSRYAGKRVRRYTYTVTNYPTGDQSIQADLLQYRSRVIAGDIHSTNPGGSIQGLSIPS